MMLDAAEIAKNIEHIRERIARAAERARSNPNEITLVAVSKTFPGAAVRAAHGIGLRHFGENRVQEAEFKRPELTDLDATWHLIGHLQSNKVRRAVELFDRVDSVDSATLARKLNEAAAAQNKQLGVLIEVHMGEATKTGISESDLPQLAEAIVSLPYLELLGLMTVPPYSDDTESARTYFRKLRKLRDDTASRIGQQLPVLSMGMSHDFEIAIEEGATEVRVGTALFGERTKPATP
ncbi:MAG TPA: YggS family pyridoxal phosphate-dependent enzyme [Candidatus Acidoferrales bacterium]